jgi:hypothetical protein
MWHGRINSTDPRQLEITYVGEGDLLIFGVPHVRLPPVYGSVRTISVSVPAGRRTLALKYRFDDGSRARDGVSHGPYAILRVHARRAIDENATFMPLRAEDLPRSWRGAALFIDLVMSVALITLLWFYWRLLAPERGILALLCIGGTSLAVDPTATMSRPPPLDYVHREFASGLPQGLGLTVLTCLLFVILLRRRTVRQSVVAYFAVFWLSFFRRDFLNRGFDLVFYRPAGDDWLTYESFARSILQSWSLEGGESVFY